MNHTEMASVTRSVSPRAASVRSVALGALSLLGLWLLGAGCASGPAPRETRPPQTLPKQLPAPVGLPPQARELLRERMERHGAEMTFLVATVVMLDYEATEQLALEISREPRLGRPAPGELDTLNAMLPPRFFELQDALVQRAQATAAAARAQDDARLGQAFGELGATCVACHSTYLRSGAGGDAEAPPAD